MAAEYYNQAPKRFSRRWWLAQGQTPLWVIVVTVLIWVYADLEFTQTKELKVTLDLQPGPSLTVLGGRRSFPLTLKVQGNGNGIERFEKVLTEKGHHLPVDVSHLDVGVTKKSVEELLSRNEEFPKSGLSIVSSSMPDIEFEMDRLVTKSVPVQFVSTGATLHSPASIEPPTVDIRCASSLWLEIEKTTSNPPVIRTQEKDLRDYPPGRQRLDVRLHAQIGEKDVEIVGPAMVAVEFQIDRVTSSRQIQLNVRTLTPWVWGEEKDTTWREYRLVISDPIERRPMVTVIGSPEALEQLQSRMQSNSNEVKAFIELTEDDTKPVESFIPRPVIVVFPADLDVKLDPNEKPTVKFKLEKQR